MIRSITVFVLLATATSAAAAPRDSRIRDLAYDEDAVTSLKGCYGFQSMIEFSPDERIENIAVGDAMRWQVTPNKRADLLFLKPAQRSGRSNMTVVTDRRRYNFELTAAAGAACARGEMVYDLRFRYPAEPPAAATPTPIATAPEAPPPAPAPRNTAYSFTGSAANVPQRAFDDGKSTYLRWADGIDTPAIYALGTDKSERLVNYTIEGDYVVLDEVAPAYVLRRGNAVAVLYDDAYQTPKLDAAAPQPRAEAEPAGSKPASRLARLFTPKETSR